MSCAETGHYLSGDSFELRRSDGATFLVNVCLECGAVVVPTNTLKKRVDKEGGERGEEFDSSCKHSYGFNVDPGVPFSDDVDDWWSERHSDSSSTA